MMLPPEQKPLRTAPVASKEPEGLVHYLRCLRRHWLLVASASALGAVAAFLISLPQAPVYRARASLEILQLNDDFLNLRQILPLSETNPNSAPTDLQTQIRILQSESLIERVLGRLKIYSQRDLPARSSLFASLIDKQPPAGTAGAFDPPIDAAKENLHVRGDSQTRIVEVTFDSPDPLFAARFVNALAAEYIDQSIEVRTKLAQRTSDRMSGQLEELRQRLRASEDALQLCAQKNGLVLTSDKANVSEEKLRMIQDASTRAHDDRVAKQSRHEIARSSPIEALPDVVNDPSLREVLNRLTDLRRQRAEMATVYRPDFEKVKRLDAQIQSLESAMTAQRTIILQRIRNEYAESLQRERTLDADFRNQSRVVARDAEKSIQYSLLKREVDSNRLLYDAMLQRVREVSVASAMATGKGRVVDIARTPRLPVSPKLGLNATLGLLAGLLLGISYVLIREYLDRSIQEPDDLETRLDVPQLGVIPSAEGRSANFSPLRPSSYFARQPQLLIPPNGNGGSADGSAFSLVKSDWRKSAISESFRSVLTSLMFSSPTGRPPKVIVITSGGPMEGKSTVVSNLGVALAEIGRKVLLIDADLRKPRLHEIFAIPNELGFSSLLQVRKTPLTSSAAGLAVQTAVPGLQVLTSGIDSESAVKQLYTGTLAAIIDEVRTGYDHILIDTPPMLEIPDARIIARYSDGVLLVVRAGKTSPEEASAARQRLQQDQSILLGTVLNDWVPRRGPRPQYGYYGHSSSHPYASSRA